MKTEKILQSSKVSDWTGYNIISRNSQIGSINYPAISATEIFDNGITTSGYYYIKPQGFSGTAQNVYCDMSTSGGKWMLMSWTSTNDATWRHVRDENTWWGSNGGCTTINTDVSISGAASLGQSFINSLVLTYRSIGLVACYRLTVGSGFAGQVNNFYFNADANAEYLPVSQRQGSQGGTNTVNTVNNARAGNTWLKTCNTGYSTSGQGGAGTATGGTSITFGSQGWGIFPFNMVNGYAGNWGTCIDWTYNQGGSSAAFTSSTWPAAHHNGWGVSLSMWIKVAST